MVSGVQKEGILEPDVQERSQQNCHKCDHCRRGFASTQTLASHIRLNVLCHAAVQRKRKANELAFCGDLKGAKTVTKMARQETATALTLSTLRGLQVSLLYNTL